LLRLADRIISFKVFIVFDKPVSLFFVVGAGVVRNETIFGLGRRFRLGDRRMHPDIAAAQAVHSGVVPIGAPGSSGRAHSAVAWPEDGAPVDRLPAVTPPIFA
jgi:hypothetical protein